MNSENDTAVSTVKKSKKINIAAVIGIAVLVLLLAGLILGTTGAKYIEERDVDSGFEAARFNAVILGDLGSSEGQDHSKNRSKQEALTELSTIGHTIKVFGDTLDASSLQPGDEKSLDFTVSNGLIPQDEIENNAAQVAVQYSVRLRTTGYLPVEYKFTALDFSAEIPVEREYKADSPIKVIPTGGNESDEKWNEYRFIDNLTKKEATFTLKYDLRDDNLDINLHSFKISWPIKQFESGLYSNDQHYMKEVDLIEAYVVVQSLNSNGAVYREKSSGSFGYISDDVYAAKGLIRLRDPDQTYTPFSPYSKDYELDFRAIRYTSGFTLVIEDGLNPVRVEEAYDDYAESVPMNTEYIIKLQVPVFEGSIDGQAVSTKNFIYKIQVPGQAEPYEKYGDSSYFIKDVHDNVITENLKTDITTDERALAYFIDKGYDAGRYYLYRTDTFKKPDETISVVNEDSDNADEENGNANILLGNEPEEQTVTYPYLVKNSNVKLSRNSTQTVEWVSDVFNWRDSIIISAVNSSGVPVDFAGDEGLKMLSPSHKINVKIEYKFDNPHAYGGSGN